MMFAKGFRRFLHNYLKVFLPFINCPVSILLLSSQIQQINIVCHHPHLLQQQHHLYQPILALVPLVLPQILMQVIIHHLQQLLLILPVILLLLLVTIIITQNWIPNAIYSCSLMVHSKKEWKQV